MPSVNSPEKQLLLCGSPGPQVLPGPGVLRLRLVLGCSPLSPPPHALGASSAPLVAHPPPQPANGLARGQPPPPSVATAAPAAAGPAPVPSRGCRGRWAGGGEHRTSSSGGGWGGRPPKPGPQTDRLPGGGERLGWAFRTLVSTWGPDPPRPLPRTLDPEVSVPTRGGHCSGDPVPRGSRRTGRCCCGC